MLDEGSHVQLAEFDEGGEGTSALRFHDCTNLGLETGGEYLLSRGESPSYCRFVEY